MDLLPGSPNSLLPCNGGCSKLAGIWEKGAPHLLDGMPVRSQNANYGYNVRLEEGEVWEKGLEMITMDGDTIRPTFASSSLDPSSSLAGTGRPGQSRPMNLNAEKTQPPGVLQANHRALDAQMDGPRGGGHAPNRAGEAGGHHALSSTVVMLGRPADFQQLSRSAISTSGGLGGSTEASGQANTSLYTVGEVGSKGERLHEY